MPRPELLAACLLLAPSAAHAQLDTGERFDGEGHRVLVEVGGAERREGSPYPSPFPRDLFPPEDGIVRPRPASFAGTTFALYARARALSDGDRDSALGVGGALTLDLELAMRGDATGDGIVRAGNPLVSAALGWASRDLVLRVALGAGLPLTSAFDYQPNEARTYALLRASQGHGDVWLASEESVPIVLRARVEGRVDWLFAGGDVAGALMPTIPRSGRRSEYTLSRDDLFAVAQLGAWVGVRPVPRLAIGVRGQLVVQEGAIESPEYGYGYRTEGTASHSGGLFVLLEYRGPYFFRDDQVEAFVSLIPFVRAEIDDLTLEGRLYLNLDTPDGVAFDQGATWSATLTAGWTP